MLDKSQKYADLIKKLFIKLFENTPIEDAHFPSSLTEVIIHAFHLPAKSINKEEKSLIILDHLFTTLYENNKSVSNVAISFHYRSYLDRFNLSKVEIKQFTTAQLYGVYYGDIDLRDFQMQTVRENYFYRMWLELAAIVSTKKLRHMLSQLLIDELVTLICYAFKHYREGSYPILKQLEELFKANQFPHLSLSSQGHLFSLIIWLRRGFYSVDEFTRIISSLVTISEAHLESITEQLNLFAEAEVSGIFTLFNQAIPHIIASPVKIYEEIESIKQSMLGTEYHQSLEEQHAAHTQTEELNTRFAPYISKKFTLFQFTELFKRFGLEGYPARYCFDGARLLDKKFVDKLRTIHRLFSQPSLMMQRHPRELQAMISMLLTVILHLEALFYAPHKYVEGFTQMVSAIATTGKDLERQPAIHSLIVGLEEVIINLNAHSKEVLKLKDHPIYVFDQSNAAQFSKNQRYIAQLNRRHHAAVMHISQQDTVALAEKLNINWAITTHRNGSFGYGGARNCIFLLAPVLKQAFKQGFKTISEVLALDHAELMRYFTLGVLGEKKDGSTSGGDPLFMSDDDMEIPESNLYSHLLYVAEMGSQYSFLFGYCYGRVTKYGIQYLPLATLFTQPRKIFDYARWSQLPISVMMSEVVCKPRICLNLPLGHEESHLLMILESNPLSKPSIHLGGTRYPTGKIPTHFLVGLDQHLLKFIPYALGISMICYFADPGDNFNRCALPWNDKHLWSAFSSLKGVFTKVTDTETQAEMQRRFWKNMKIFLVRVKLRRHLELGFEKKLKV